MGYNGRPKHPSYYIKRDYSCIPTILFLVVTAMVVSFICLGTPDKPTQYMAKIVLISDQICDMKDGNDLFNWLMF